MNDKYDVIVRIRLSAKGAEKSTAFGSGSAELLAGVERLGSLNRAAKEMGMAYSKAWKSIRATEEQLGFELIERKGANGSTLTERGAAFLAMYSEMTRKAQEAAEETLRKFNAK